MPVDVLFRQVGKNPGNQIAKQQPLFSSQPLECGVQRLNTPIHQPVAQFLPLCCQMQRDCTAIIRLPPLKNTILCQAICQTNGPGMGKPKHLTQDFDRKSRYVTKNDDSGSSFAGPIDGIAHLRLNSLGQRERQSAQQICCAVRNDETPQRSEFFVDIYVCIMHIL